MRILSVLIIGVILPITALADNIKVVDASDTAGSVKLVAAGATADIYVDANDIKLVKLTAGLFADDVQRVTGKKPNVTNDATKLGPNAVIIGSIGHSALVDQLIASGKVDVADVKGKWETYKIQVVDKPLPNVQSALVIVGSDRRGAAYGIFAVSEAIGVSPWYWWADVAPAHREALVVSPVTYTSKPPSVKYRGIFINDEDWGLQPWAGKTFEPETKDIGPKTYAKIFELLLRLKANFCWPAMHPSTKAFNIYPENKVVADDYGIVMGSSHCEPMLRNNVSEWGQAKAASYNYVTNRDGVLDYWRKRVEENGKFENVYTLGMRGIHDSDMAGGGTRDERVARLNAIMTDQRKMLAELVNPKVSEIPQIFCPYKEVLTLYQAGAVPPEDVTLVWADDSHGYIRQLATPEEQKRSGGFGVYYHLSYWGRPHDYLWLGTIPPALVWEELSKAYDYQSRNLWVINVGDIKPAEIGLTFALAYAYDTTKYDASNIQNFLTDFAAQSFGKDKAKEIAEVLQEYYELNFQRKPEHMGFNNSQNPPTPPGRTQFSAVDNGDEITKRMERFAALRAKADAIYASLPQDRRDGFYQLVGYPVRGSASMNEMILSTDLNHLYAAQGRASAAEYAVKAQAAHAAIAKETDYYNTTLAGGKWKNMMVSNPRRLPVFAPQAFAPTTAPAAGGTLGVAIEGRAEALAASKGNDPTSALPLISSEIGEKRFIDLFNRGTAPIEWNARSAEPWIRLSSAGGRLEKDQRILVEIDPAKLPAASGDRLAGKVMVTSGPQEYSITVNVRRPAAPAPNAVQFIEADGYLSVAAEHFTRKVDQGGGAWTTVRQLGRVGDAVAVFPTTVASVSEPSQLMSKAPRIEYDFYAYTGSEAATLTVQAVPTHRIHPGRELRYAVAIDDALPQVIDLESPENSEVWSTNVLRASAFGVTKHPLKPGKHTLRIFMVDPGVVLDHITIDLGGLKPSYLPPAETVALRQ